jgi:dimethyl sulfoxide reductase membrane subunit
VTGLTNTVTWGLYIVVFMFLVGISAGGLIVVAGAELIGSHRLEPLNRLAVIVSGTAIAAAAVSIIPDLGRPQLAWQMIVSPQPMSPLVWDMAVISIYLTIAAVDLWILTRPKPMPKACGSWRS